MQVLRYALERYPAIRAVVITGFGGVEEAVNAIRLGAVDFLIKPFQLSQIARGLLQAIEQQHLQKQNAELKAQLKRPLPVRQRHRPPQLDARGVLDARGRGADELHRADPR